MLPDYNNSLLALISSVLCHYGADTPHATLPCVDALLAENPRNVVIMLFDGMGTDAIETHLPADAFLRRHCRKTISSVFPPTTTAATVTMESGLSPAEHGWLGWSLYFSEIGDCVNLFPNSLTQGNGKKAAEYHVARTVLPYRTVFEKIGAASPAVGAHYVSPYTMPDMKTVPAVCDRVQAICGEEGMHYIYTYLPQPDYDMHDYGTKDARITRHITEINDAVAALAQALPDTLLIVTADHGLTDTRWRSLYAYPDVTDCLCRHPSIETRAMSLFVQDGRQAEFRDAFLAHFGDIYTLYTKEEVLSMYLFGDGNVHARTAGFLGDFLACATGDVSIDPAEVPDLHPFKASHGGMTPQEMNIPLIICNTARNQL